MMLHEAITPCKFVAVAGGPVRGELYMAEYELRSEEDANVDVCDDVIAPIVIFSPLSSRLHP